MYFGFRGRQFDALNALQLLDAALHLARFGGLGAKASDEGFEVFNVFALMTVRGL